MEMLQKIDSLYLVFGLLIIFIVGHLIVQRQNSLKLSLQYRLISYAVVMVILWFLLPITPSLSTFGYPEDVTDIETKQKLLKYLQRYNVAIVKTTEVVHHMIFVSTFWFLSIISTMIKHMKLENTGK